MSYFSKLMWNYFPQTLSAVALAKEDHADLRSFYFRQTLSAVASAKEDHAHLRRLKLRIPLGRTRGFCASLRNLREIIPKLVSP
jgi:hypothetical protein